MKANEIKNEVLKVEKNYKRSAWKSGVYDFSIVLLDNLDDDIEYTIDNLEDDLLNGARDWREYSYGGLALIYDYDIAESLCSPSELKKTKNGERRPNASEDWLDVQARALFQAYCLIKNCLESRTPNLKKQQ